MKAKKHTSHSNRNRRGQEPIPHQLGTHLFAMIRRNMQSRARITAPAATQLTFAF